MHAVAAELLAQVDGESRRAHQAFHDYALMGAGRSLGKLLGWYAERAAAGEMPASTKRSTIETWSARHRWQERVGAWEAEVARLEVLAWEARRREQREREWKMAARLLDRAEAMLAFPLERTRQEIGEDGEAVTIVEPAGWRQVDIARVAELASKLARLAAEMETESTRGEGVGVMVYLPDNGRQGS